jgi:outer membrane protein TolC
MSRATPPRARLAAIALAALAALAAGCSTLPPDNGLGPVREIVQQRLGHALQPDRGASDAAAIAERVQRLLATPLTADAAVQLALLNHRGLQATLAELDVRAADLAQAGRLPNPGFGFARSSNGEEVEQEIGLHFSLSRLLARPLVQRIEQRRFAAAQAATAAAVIAHAAETRRAWVEAVAATESARYAGQVLDAAAAGAELARRMAQVGNFNRLQQAREQGFYAQAALDAARAEQRRVAARERLARLLGLWGTQLDEGSFRLPDRLPDLPATPREWGDIERRAVAERLDLQAARASVEASARTLGLVRTERVLNAVELHVARETSRTHPDEPATRTWELTFELPIFDFGDLRSARAEAQHRQTLHRAAAAAIDARSEVREAYAALRHAHDIARHHRDELVPIARRISDENLLRYNGMLIGVFELLADARAQIHAVNASIDALRAYWLAEAELELALIGKAMPGSLPGANVSTAPAAAGGDPH